ncbi:MAG: 50S ribosomal protein L10 [Acidimicrobiales bacterium]
MGEPRPEKVAVVQEVREKLDAADGVLLTDYRGLDVPALATLRAALRDAGGEYKIYKNTLVRLAARELGLDIEDLLTGPTAIAFVGERADGTPGEPAGVARALKDFSRTNDLVLKGGLLDDKILSPAELEALAELPSREVLLAQLVGALQAPMGQLAGLLQALPRDLAYGLKALIDEGGPTEGAADEPAEAPADAADEPAEAPTEGAADEPAEAPADAADQDQEK